MYHVDDEPPPHRPSTQSHWRTQLAFGGVAAEDETEPRE